MQLSVWIKLIASQGKGQKVEVTADKITIFGECDGKIPFAIEE